MIVCTASAASATRTHMDSPSVCVCVCVCVLIPFVFLVVAVVVEQLFQESWFIIVNRLPLCSFPLLSIASLFFRRGCRVNTVYAVSLYDRWTIWYDIMYSF